MQVDPLPSKDIHTRSTKTTDRPVSDAVHSMHGLLMNRTWGQRCVIDIDDDNVVVLCRHTGVLSAYWASVGQIGLSTHS